jgi:hypothetical protein
VTTSYRQPAGSVEEIVEELPWVGENSRKFLAFYENRGIVPQGMAQPITGPESRSYPNIDPIGPLDYILDLAHTWNCSWIGKAAPGEAIKVLLYPARDLHPLYES